MRIASIAVAIALGAVSASATQPTLDQLMATPSAADIVSRWKQVCFDHAGDTRAQRRAVRELRIDWPYQAVFQNTRDANMCIIVSTTEEGATIDNFYRAAVEAVEPAVVSQPQNEGDVRTATVEKDGRVYGVEMSILVRPEITIASIALNQTRATN